MSPYDTPERRRLYARALDRITVQAAELARVVEAAREHPEYLTRGDFDDIEEIEARLARAIHLARGLV